MKLTATTMTRAMNETTSQKLRWLFGFNFSFSSSEICLLLSLTFKSLSLSMASNSAIILIEFLSTTWTISHCFTLNNSILNFIKKSVCLLFDSALDKKNTDL